MQRLIAIAFRGNIIALETLDTLLTRDCFKDPHEHQFLTPHAELALPHLNKERLFRVESLGLKEKLWPIAEEIYRNDAIYGRKSYGPFGDALSFLVLDEFTDKGMVPVVFDFAAPKAFLKPSLASDMIVIASNGSEYYFIGIVRGSGHANGVIAPAAGFLDLVKTNLESPLHAAVRETAEEASIFVSGENGLPLTERELLSRDVYDVHVEFCARHPLPHPGILQFVGAYPTEDEYVTEEPYGLKRVYWSFGHVLYVEFPKTTQLSCEMLKGMCRGQRGEVREIYVKNLFQNGQPSFPEFPIGHHRKIFEAACVALVARGKFPAFQLSV